MERRSVAAVGRSLLSVLAVSTALAGCAARTQDPLDVVSAAVTAGGFSNAKLALQVSLSSCGANQAQDFFRVVNNGTTAVALSDIKIKLWVDDTSAASVVPVINTGGCLTNASGCYHQASGVSIAPARFSPACGPDPSHQANWEITISTSDHTLLKPGESWDNVQTQVHLSSYGTFTPGTAQWWSPCGSGQGYAPVPHFGLSYQNLPVFSPGAGVGAPDCRAPHGTQRLSGVLRSEITSAPLVGPVPATTPLSVTVGLPLQKKDLLATFVQQVSDPNSPSYRHYLAPGDLTATYGPTPTDYQILQSWAQDRGLTLGAADPHRLLLSVSGTAAAIEQALYVNFNNYLRPDGTQFYGLDREPSIDLAAAVLYVSGMDNMRLSKPAASGLGLGDVQATDLRKAYVSNASDPSCPNPSTLLGDQQCIGLLAMNTSFDPIDIKAYVAKEGLDTNVDTQVVPLAIDSYVNPSPAFADILEAEADIEVALAMAPHATVGSFSVPDGKQESALAAMASSTPLCRQLSTSWLLNPNPNQLQYLAYVFPAQGQTFFDASGDAGVQKVAADAGSLGDIASAVEFVHMTSVGGTVLAGLPGGGFVESAWSGSGGGFDDRIPIPPYQADMHLAEALGGSDVGLNFPDVSSVASSVTLVVSSPATFDGCNPDTTLIKETVFHADGTSLAAPTWAGFMALVNQQSAARGLGPVGYANPVLYAIGKSTAYGRCFNDVSAGGSSHFHPAFIGACSSGSVPDGPGASAGLGFDLATGWGSPKCGLINQLASSAPAPSLSVSTGDHDACAVSNGGDVWCWGLNSAGEIGDGTTTDSSVPVRTMRGWPAGVTAQAVGAGDLHACALLSDGTVWCWGRNSAGQLGNGTTTDSSVPVPVGGLGNVKDLAIGGNHSCARLGNQTVSCWGSNSSGQLGSINGGGFSSSPVQVTSRDGAPLTGFTSLAAGGAHTCAVQSPDGVVLCWGGDANSQLGDGHGVWGGGTINDAASFPVPVVTPAGSLHSARSVSAGVSHTCASTTGGDVLCWGANDVGQLGNGSAGGGSALPVTVLISGAQGPVAAGGSFSCAVLNATAALTDGTVWCWGRNFEGQLADGGKETTSPIPVQVLFLDHVVQVSAGTWSGCALSSNGDLSCWGYNRFGEVGNGTLLVAFQPFTIRLF